MESKKRIWWMFLGIFGILGLFIYAVLRPSEEAKALAELRNCSDISAIKSNWDRYGSNLVDGNMEERRQSEYLQAVIKKVDALHLKKRELKEVFGWLPPLTDNLNVIIVPDLSNRIDPAHYPDQKQRDLSLIRKVFEQFENRVRLKNSSKDYFAIEMADKGQVSGLFKTFADSLIFDLSKHRGNNRAYFHAHEDRFEKYLNDLYNTAVSTPPSGANYLSYVANKLDDDLKKSTVADRYRNIVIFVTDGYLEIGPKNNVRSISPDAGMRAKSCITGNFPIPPLPPETVGLEFPQAEIYLFEVTARAGDECGMRLIENWWKEWFESLHIQNIDDAFIFKSQDGMSKVNDKVEDLF